MAEITSLVSRLNIRGVRPWEEFVGSSFPWLEVDNVGRDFRADVAYRAFGQRSLALISAADCRVTRTRRGVDRSDSGHLKILWQRAGSMAVAQDGRHARLQPGMVAICDTGRPYRLRLAGGASLAVLTLPYHAVPGWLNVSQQICANVLGDRMVLDAALAAALLLLDDEDNDSDGADRILQAVQLMLAASLRRSADARPAAPARLHLDLVVQHILLHIDNPDLSPEEVAAALHVSRRTLYGLFKEHALTPSRFIRDTRLSSVREALANRNNANRSVLDIALDYGFTDGASFCRTFKSALGVSPSRWRERALAQD